MSVLSNRNVPKKEPKEQKPVYNQNDAIPPELLVRRDNTVRYVKDGPIYATDGKVGQLKKVVVDENTAEVAELIVCPDGATDFMVLPADVVDRSSGDALFITLNRVQFAERQASGPGYTRNHFAKADLKSLLRRKDGSRPMTPRRSVTNAGNDFVETPLASPINRLNTPPQPPTVVSTAAD
jgi:sporulation protein YlmC with PRC-barrel domain